MFIFPASAQMEKEEETTRELLLPNWQGSSSHGLTIAQRDDGVFVQEVMQNSPAARTGVVKEGESPMALGLGARWDIVPTSHGVVVLLGMEGLGVSGFFEIGAVRVGVSLSYEGPASPCQGTRLWAPPSTSTTCSQPR